MNRFLAAFGLAVLLSSCATTAPEPVVKPVTVEIPVPVPCVRDPLVPAPAYPDTPEALKAAPELNPALVRASQRFLASQYRAEAPRWGEIDAGRWNGFIEFLVKTGVVKAQPQSSSFFTNAYLPAAVKK